MQHWFALVEHPEWYRPDRMPIALWQQMDRDRVFYTLPDFGDGVKLAIHHDGELTDPDRVQRTVSEDDDARVLELATRCFTSVPGTIRDRAVCLYTNTPDGHFLIDRHPVHPEVLIVSACSGHGFKFATVIGEGVAQLVADEPPSQDLSLFSNRYRVSS
jgi:sarcosine oxidase